jgi:hypothetical protein
VDDVLIEQVRKYHCDKLGEPFEPIGAGEDDVRSRRITAYLNLVNGIVQRQSQSQQASRFEDGSEITRYFRMLPELPLKTVYKDMLGAPDGLEKDRLQAFLRTMAVLGRIDVNIMTKLDRDAYHRGQKLPPEFSDAMAALRGFACSVLSSAIMFSAGINQRLYWMALKDTAADFENNYVDTEQQQAYCVTHNGVEKSPAGSDFLESWIKTFCSVGPNHHTLQSAVVFLWRRGNPTCENP